MLRGIARVVLEQVVPRRSSHELHELHELAHACERRGAVRAMCVATVEMLAIRVLLKEPKICRAL
jgi:hypothetical protein